MCGIGGVVTWDQRHRIDRAMLKRMNAAIAHRGPDGSGEWLNHEKLITSFDPQCGLVHRRLAVIDLDPRANQPFADGVKQRWIVYNGEIYNFKSLRKEISSVLPSYRWRTTCDTEVLLASYLAWGEKCVEKLNGMFAFAIWDQTYGTLYLARDRMGQKPLYYAAIGMDGKAWDHHRPPMVLAFGSELSCVRQTDWLDCSINDAALGDYLRFGYVPTPATIYNGAWKLPPGTWMQITRDRVHMERYFDPACRPACADSDDEKNRDKACTPTDADAPLLTRERVTIAVKRQLVADVPLGCFLSGGVDSSIIAAAMKAACPGNQRVLTFSIGFDDPRYDETEFAAEVAKHLGTTHRSFKVDFNAADDLPKLARVFGEPFADSSALPTHYLSRETRSHVKVALSGDGGDELFGGYDRYRAIRLSESLRRLPFPLRTFASTRLWQLLPGTHPKSRLTRLKRLLATVRLPAAARYQGYMRIFGESQIRALLPERRRAEPILGFDHVFNDLLKDRDVVRAAGAMDRLSYLPDDLLTKVDRSSMLHALEVRSPFMDHELVTFASSLTTAQLIGGGGKRMLREAFSKDLPASVFSRPKKGFAVPIGAWFRSDLSEMLRGMLFAEDSFTKSNLNSDFVRRLVDEHQVGKRDHAHRLYALLMLELWWRQQMSM
jgi:asparagine synthase (glutamine-hydrolysing)